MSDRLPNIGESPFGKRSPFLNDLQGQQKESSVTRLRKTIKAEQHLPTSETENGKKRDIDHSAKNLDRKLNSNQFEQVNSTHLIEKKNPFTLNDVMSTLSNEGIEYEYDLLENNDINITIKSKLFNPRQMQIISQLNFGMDISGNFSKVIQF